jgi:hypothetical protein
MDEFYSEAISIYAVVQSKLINNIPYTVTIFSYLFYSSKSIRKYRV